MGNDFDKLLNSLPFTIEEEDNFLINYFKGLCNIGTIFLFSFILMLGFSMPILFIIYWANKLLG